MKSVDIAGVAILDQYRRHSCPHECGATFRIADMDAHLEQCPVLAARRQPGHPVRGA